MRPFCCLLITHLLLLGSNAWFKHAFMNMVAEADPKRFCAFICIQGDANNAPDPEPLMPKQIKGVVVYHLPYVGHIALGIDGPAKIAAITVIGLALIGYAIWQLLLAGRDRVRHHPDSEDETAPGEHCTDAEEARTDA